MLSCPLPCSQIDWRLGIRPSQHEMSRSQVRPPRTEAAPCEPNGGGKSVRSAHRGRVTQPRGCGKSRLLCELILKQLIALKSLLK